MSPETFGQVYAAERAALGLAPDEHPTALCLSGGGIRSASFAIGALQAFAKHGQLTEFHYLSTVSGGGFAGSWLTDWTRRDGLESVSGALAASVDDPGAEPMALRRLRKNSRYLAPLGGFGSLDTWTLLGRYITNLLVTWLTLLPALMAILAAPLGLMLLLKALNLDPRTTEMVKWLAGGLCIMLAFLVVVPLRDVIRAANATSKADADATSPEASFAFALGFGIVGTIGLAAKLYVDAQAHPTPIDPLVWRAANEPLSLPALGAAFGAIFGGLFMFGGGIRATVYASIAGAVGSTLGVIAFQAVVSLAYTVGGAAGPAWWLILWLGPATPSITFFLGTVALAVLQTSAFEEHREALARWGSGHLRLAVVWLCLAGFSLGAPKLLEAAPELLASVGGLSGLTAWVIARVMGRRSEKTQHPALWVYSILLLAAVAIAFAALAWLTTRLGIALVAGTGGWPAFASVTAMALGLFGVGLAFGWLVDINASSLSGLYRLRLVRAWLGAGEAPAGSGAFTRWLENDVKMSDAWVPAQHGKRLFPVINLAVNDLSGDRLELQDRKALTFPVTCMHVGYEDSYRPAKTYAGGLTMGQAIAISGAAINPAMGFYSSAGLAAATTLLNVRMGVWKGNPASADEAVWRRSGPSVGLWPLLRGAVGRIHTRGDYVQLSDGGHVDNLGLYEMVRRGCRSIVVVDGGADPKSRFSDLTRTIRNIRIDLGVIIDIAGLDFTAGAPPIRWASGKIRYSDGPDGELIYLRPGLLGDAPLDVLGYAASAPSFPHETTADQFFSEEQFESYRALGQHTITSLYAREWQMRDLIDSKSPISGLVHLVRRATSRAVAAAGQPTHAGGVIYRMTDPPQFLVVQSSAKLSEWVLPKGRVRAGERLAQAAQREAREEAGAMTAAVAQLPNAEYDGPTGPVRVSHFLLEHTGAVAMVEDRETRWLTLQGGLDVLTFKEDRAALRAAADRLSGRLPDDARPVPGAALRSKA